VPVHEEDHAAGLCGLRSTAPVSLLAEQQGPLVCSTNTTMQNCKVSPSRGRTGLRTLPQATSKAGNTALGCPTVCSRAITARALYQVVRARAPQGWLSLRVSAAEGWRQAHRPVIAGQAQPTRINKGAAHAGRPELVHPRLKVKEAGRYNLQRGRNDGLHRSIHCYNPGPRRHARGC